MGERPPLGAISIGSNDIHLLVATSDGIGTFERHANQSMLAELVGAVRRRTTTRSLDPSAKKGKATIGQRLRFLRLHDTINQESISLASAHL
jgi:exopolyphosphatase/pppGpp-phosphohydrolase